MSAFKPGGAGGYAGAGPAESAAVKAQKEMARAMVRVIYILYTSLHIYERVALRWVTTAAASSRQQQPAAAACMFLLRSSAACVCVACARIAFLTWVRACVVAAARFKKPQGVSTGGPVDTETAAKRQEFAENMGQKTDFGQAPKGYVAGMGAWRSIRSSACF